MFEICIILKLKTMLNYTKKKKNKLNTYRAVRENIQLNKNNLSAEQQNNINYDNLVFQMAENNLMHQLNKHKKGLSGKLMVKWWEN